MLTNDFLGDNIARLGFGAMRLPVVDGDASNVDQPALDAMVDAAIAAGVNYFDTAYPYHGGMSEIALGRSLSRYPRERFFLATKYPGHQIAKTYDPAATFEEQLTKCGVEYFDFYLLHNIYEASIDVYLDEQWGIADYFVEQKKNGRIRHLGFSCHGRPETLGRFLDYGARKYAELEQREPETAALFAGNNIMEFCQIQLNYLDWTLQDAAAKTALLEGMNIPIVVMEPLRGGKLAHLNDAQMQRLNAGAGDSASNAQTAEDPAAASSAQAAESPAAVANSQVAEDPAVVAKAQALAANTPARSAVEWSFRWLLGIPSVKTILSGMSDLAQVEENCRIFQESDPLTEAEQGVLMDVAESLKGGVPCTACRYCVDSCPQEIDIPLMMNAYNDLQFDTSFTVSMQMDAVPEGQRAQDCIQCESCVQMCPQGIDIPTVLEKLAATLDAMPKWADLCRQREEAAAKLAARSQE